MVMIPFMTERQIEALLETSVRELRLPNGESVLVRLSKLVWDSYDMIIREGMGIFTPSVIMEIACLNREETGESLEISLTRTCGSIHRDIEAELGKDLPSDE